MLNDRLRAVAMGVVALVWLSLPATAFAWVYPEHRDIAVGAVEQLDPERRALSTGSGATRAARTGSACASRAQMPSKG